MYQYWITGMYSRYLNKLIFENGVVFRAHNQRFTVYPDIVHMSISIVTRVCLALSHSFAVLVQINPTYLIQLRISSCRPLPLQSPNVFFFIFSNMYS